MPEEKFSRSMEEVKTDLSKYQEHVEIIPTRTTKIPTSKPPTNPLQFVKVGPAPLYKTAQEQIKKVEAVKKIKEEVKEDGVSDWQSNLDNWKCSRRKRQEHIIERVVEVKKLELEDFDKQARKNKTFKELMEERSSKGRKCGLPIYEDDDNDLSDLGLTGASSTNNTEEQDEIKSENTEDIPPDKLQTDSSLPNKIIPEEDVVDGISSPTPNNSREQKEKAKPVQSARSQPIHYASRKNSLNIERKISECTSNSQNNNSNKKPIVLPKIDINERKNLFEKGTSNGDDSKLRKSVSSGNISNTKSIKDRLSMFGKPEEPVNSKVDKAFLPKVSVKERLSSIERQNSEENSFNAKSLEDLKSSQSIKTSLSRRGSASHNDSTAHHTSPNTKTEVADNEFTKVQTKEQECTIVESTCSEPNSASHSNNYYHEQTSAHSEYPKIKPESVYLHTDSSEKCLSSDDEYRNTCTKHFRHRSLDSLNSDSKFDSSPFARVQSFEELDFRDRGNYPASSLSGDTDREDSGIHTADVSSCVSQSDDCDTMSMGDADMHHLEATNLSVIPESQQEPALAAPCHSPMLNQASDLESENQKFITTELISDNERDQDLEQLIGETKHEINFSEQSVLNNSESVLDDTLVLAVSNTASVTAFIEMERSREQINDLKEEPIIEEIITNGRQELDEKGSDVNFSQQSPEKTSLFSSDLIVPNLAFPLDLDYSEVTREPPKEPPPPPPGMSDDECEDNLSQENQNEDAKTNLKRNDSTKRLKREIRLKRSSFLGIDGSNVDDYLDAELQVKSPVDVVGLLANELQYRYSDYQFAYEKVRNNNNEDFGYEKIQNNMDKYYNYGNLLEDKSNSYSHRQSVCSGDSGVASPSSTPQPQLDQEDHFSQADNYHQTNHSRENGFNNFHHSPPKQNFNSTHANANQVQNQEPPNFSIEDKYKEAYQQKTQFYNDQIKRELDRTQTSYKNFNGEPKNVNQLQTDYYTATNQNLQYAESNNTKMINGQRDSYKQGGGHNDNQLYNPYAQDCGNKQNTLTQEHIYNNGGNMYQNTDAYLQQDYVNNQTVQPDYSNSDLYPQYNNYSHEDLNNQKYGQHYKTEILNGNEYTYNNYNEPECPNILRRSLQDITQKSIALYENTSTFQDDYRKPHKIKETNRQSRTLPAGGRSMPNLKDIKYRNSHPSPNQLVNRRSAPPEQYAIHSTSSSRIPKPLPNENAAQVKRKPKPTSLYNYNQHWLIQEAEHRRILEQQQRKSLPLQSSSTKVLNEGKVHHVNSNSNSRSNGALSQNKNWNSKTTNEKSLPDAIIQNITRRVQQKLTTTPVRRPDEYESKVQVPVQSIPATNLQHAQNTSNYQYYNREKMLSVSGKNKCSFCNEELGRGAAMIIESLHLFYHIHCFKCSVCCIQLGDGLMGTDVRVRNNKLHCQNCYSNDDGVKFSCV